MRTEKSLESLKNNIIGKFVTTEAIEQGFKYEEEVFAGKHGKISKLVKDLEKQKWGSKIIDCGDFYIRLSGKVDVIDTERKIIYDIKHTSNYNPKHYLDSIQHYYYFYLFPEIEDFYYLVAQAKNKEDVKVLHVKRPPEQELQEKVKESITTIIEGLKEFDLLETFKKYKLYKGR